MSSHSEYKDERPGQFEVPAGEIVAEVKKLLAKQRGE